MAVAELYSDILESGRAKKIRHSTPKNTIVFVFLSKNTFLYFLSVYFPHHDYDIQGIIDGTEPQPAADAEGRADWDLRNQLALDKLKYYVSDSIHAIVWKGQENLTAKDYYDTMNTLLLRTTMRSIVQLEKCLNSCRMRDRRLLEWMCAMANIYTC